MTRHYPDLGSASGWLKREGISFQPIRSTSMEFLRSLLRRRFARAHVATSRDVGCLLRLIYVLDQTSIQYNVQTNLQEGRRGAYSLYGQDRKSCHGSHVMEQWPVVKWRWIEQIKFSFQLFVSTSLIPTYANLGSVTRFDITAISFARSSFGNPCRIVTHPFAWHNTYSTCHATFPPVAPFRPTTIDCET